MNGIDRTIDYSATEAGLGKFYDPTRQVITANTFTSSNPLRAVVRVIAVLALCSRFEWVSVSSLALRNGEEKR